MSLLQVRAEPRTWFGVITEPGRELTLTVSMGLMIVAATVQSVLIPDLGSWLFVATGLTAAAWYTHMMRRWRARKAHPKHLRGSGD